MDSNYTCSAAANLDSALKKYGEQYQQVLLKECKYIGKKIIRYIKDSLSNFSSDDEENDF